MGLETLIERPVEFGGFEVREIVGGIVLAAITFAVAAATLVGMPEPYETLALAAVVVGIGGGLAARYRPWSVDVTLPEVDLG